MGIDTDTATDRHTYTTHARTQSSQPSCSHTVHAENAKQCTHVHAKRARPGPSLSSALIGFTILRTQFLGLSAAAVADMDVASRAYQCSKHLKKWTRMRGRMTSSEEAEPQAALTESVDDAPPAPAKWSKFLARRIAYGSRPPK